MIALRAHNTKPYRDLKEKLETVSRCVLVSATGTGKTYITGRYVEDMGWTGTGDVLILIPKHAAGIAWQGILPDADILTYQGMLKRQPDLSGYKLVICDETHHLGAAEWGKVFTALSNGFHGKILGLTATPVRYLDNQRNVTDEFFDGNMVAGVQLPQAINDGILPTFEYITALYSVPQWKRRTNPYTEKLYSRFDLMSNEYSCRNILKKHLEGQDPFKAVVFVDAITAIPEAMDLCISVFPEAKHLSAHSRKEKEENLSTYTEFEEESGDAFLYVVDILNEGIHLKGVDTEIMFRKTRSPAVYLQQLGRVLDAGNCNTRVRIFDFVANHMNLRQYGQMQDDTVRWISGNIGAPDRQVIQHDYALEQLELADKIRLLENGGWTEEEDNLLRQHYKEEGGIKKLMNLLPHRSRVSIVSHAASLGLTEPRKVLASNELREDIRKYYGKEDGWKTLEGKYPDLSRATITNIANRMGIKTRVPRQAWTEEEDRFLEKNQGLPVAELEKLLPGRSRQSIAGRKYNLGLKTIRNTHKWTEEEINVLKENPELTNQQIVDRYLPHLSASMVQRKRLKERLNFPKKWTEEKVAAFKEAYEMGGKNAVKELPEFADLSDKVIAGAAHRYGCKVKNTKRKGTWTEKEKELCREWLATPEGQRIPKRELAEKLPRHTYNGLKDMLRRLGNGAV